MRILGIDPGTRLVGYGIIEKRDDRLRVVECGVIKADKPAQDLAQRLKTIYQELKRVIKRFRPDAIAVEKVFYAQDPQATIKMGEARGVILLCAVDMKINTFEYSVAEIKKAVTGYGRAHKTQIQEMVKYLLRLAEVPKSPDAADALAVALCHAYRSR